MGVQVRTDSSSLANALQARDNAGTSPPRCTSSSGELDTPCRFRR